MTITPQMLGAIGDGIADDTVPLAAALQSGSPVLLDGKYKITGPIAVQIGGVNPPGLTITGHNRGDSQIILASATAGITVSLDSVANPYGANSPSVVARDFTFVPAAAPSGVPLRIEGEPASGSSERSFLIENVGVIPSGVGNYSPIGFDFYDCRNSQVLGCSVSGQYFGYFGSGIRWGGGAGSAPVDLVVQGCHLNHWNKGVELAPNDGGATSGANDWQGVNVNGCTFLACEYGIHASTIDNFAEWLSIIANHFNVRTAGVYAPDVGHLFVSGNYVLVIGVAPGGTAWGIYTHIHNIAGYKSQYGHIHGNAIQFAAGGAANRIAIHARADGGAMRTFVNANTGYGATVDLDIDPTNPYVVGGVLTLQTDGVAQFNKATAFKANGSVATRMTSLGPAGASTTVREWLTIKNAAGQIRYIPCY